VHHPSGTNNFRPTISPSPARLLTWLSVKMQDDVDIGQIGQREYAEALTPSGHALNYQNFLQFDMAM